MIENLFKLGCLMLSGVIAFAYLIVSFENQASATAIKVGSTIYTTATKNATPSARKKNCSCCDERKEQARRLMRRGRKIVEQARERARTEQHVTKVGVPQ